MTYLFIKENRSSFPVKKMCQVLQVSQSGYYRWLKSPHSPRKEEKIKDQRANKGNLRFPQ
jgi:putative transposase